MSLKVSTYPIGEKIEFPVELLPLVNDFISSNDIEDLPFTFDISEPFHSVMITGKENSLMPIEWKGQKKYIEAYMLQHVFNIILEAVKPCPVGDDVWKRTNLHGCYFINRDDGWEGSYIIKQICPMMVTPYVRDMCLENEFLHDIIK